MGATEDRGGSNDGLGPEQLAELLLGGHRQVVALPQLLEGRVGELGGLGRGRRDERR